VIVRLPLVQLSPGVAALVDSAAWALLSIAVGYRAHRQAPERLERDSWLTAPRPFERDGRFYEGFRIRGWKDRLPEAGGFFRGGTSKRRVPGRSTHDLRRFAVETRRAEGVHWRLLALGPAFVLWNPPALAAVMVTFGICANLPFIAVQRYNRQRLGRVLARREADSARR
jgi:glycosyl-4,4'-diaponeurosporenoate acyltransferase